MNNQQIADLIIEEMTKKMQEIVLKISSEIASNTPKETKKTISPEDKKETIVHTLSGIYHVNCKPVNLPAKIMLPEQKFFDEYLVHAINEGILAEHLDNLSDDNIGDTLLLACKLYKFINPLSREPFRKILASKVPRMLDRIYDILTDDIFGTRAISFKSLHDDIQFNWPSAMSGSYKKYDDCPLRLAIKKYNGSHGTFNENLKFILLNNQDSILKENLDSMIKDFNEVKQELLNVIPALKDFDLKNFV